MTILPGLARRRGLAVEPWVPVDCKFGTARSHETTTRRGYGRPRLLGPCSEEHWHGMEGHTLTAAQCYEHCVNPEVPIMPMKGWKSAL